MVNPRRDPDVVEKAPLRVLFVEDRPADVELSLAELKRAGFEVSADTVETGDAFQERLRAHPYDLILADHGLPGWTGLEAVELLRQQGLDIPFILVTGSLGDETAVEYMKSGATDYVLKDRLARLPVAIRRALEEKALREERRRVEAEMVLLRSAIEQAAEAVLITDAEGKIQFVNPAFTWMTGYTREEALGQNPRFLKSGQQDALFYRMLWGAILAGKTWHGEIINRRKDGSLYPEEMSITPVRAGGEEISHFIAIKEDITERKRGEETLRQTTEMLQALIHASPLAITALDPDGKVKLWNPAAERILGWSQEEVLGRLLPTVPEDKQDEHRGLRERVLREGGFAGVEVRRQRKDGSLVDISLSTAPLTDAKGQLTGMVCVMADISERKRAEAERARTLQLQVENEALARADRLKSEFLADMSHELRSPLNSILGFSQLLLESPEGSFAPQQHEDLTIVHEKAQHLLALVNDLLDLAQIESGQVLFEWSAIPVQDLLVRTLDAFTVRLREKNLQQRVEVEPPHLTVYADSRRLEEILTNLVANAVRFTSQGGLTLRARPEADHVLFSVEDTGAGIDPLDQKRIFDKFYQARRLADGTGGGTGLGLAITKKLVEQHGGTMGVESALGRGSRFFFTLPRLQPVAAAKTAGGAGTQVG